MYYLFLTLTRDHRKIEATNNFYGYFSVFPLPLFKRQEGAHEKNLCSGNLTKQCTPYCCSEEVVAHNTIYFSLAAGYNNITFPILSSLYKTYTTTPFFIPEPSVNPVKIKSFVRPVIVHQMAPSLPNSIFLQKTCFILEGGTSLCRMYFLPRFCKVAPPSFCMDTRQGVFIVHCKYIVLLYCYTGCMWMWVKM